MQQASAVRGAGPRRALGLRHVEAEQEDRLRGVTMFLARSGGDPLGAVPPLAQPLV